MVLLIIASNRSRSRDRLLVVHRRIVTFTDLGPLEQAVVELLWTHGECSVQDVARRLDRQLAYTTVMTTLDRLFKKGVLERQLIERAFHYKPKFSREDMDRRQASAFVDGFLKTRASGELLFSCLVEAVGQYDAALLDELEEKIRRKRKEMKKS